MAIDPELAIQVIRETLDTVVAPDIASAALLEALDPYGGLLPAGDELNGFVQGPLKEALRKRLRGGSQAIIDQLESLIAPALANSKPPPRPLWAEKTTAQVAVGDGPVRVLVTASRPGLAIRLRVSVGSHRVAVLTASNAEGTHQMVRDSEPSIIVVDATDPPSSTPDALAQALRKGPGECLCIVWGSNDRLYARHVVRLLEGSSTLRVAPVDEREGFDPLLDLIRSRSET